MCAYGVGPYGVGSLGVPGLPPEPETAAALSSSRKIDFATKRYVIASDGGFDAMDDTAQRVMLLILFNTTETDIITPQEMQTTASRIRKALEPMTSGREPAIRIEEVVVSDDGKAGTFRSVRYKSLWTGTQQTLFADGTLQIDGKVVNP